MNAVISESTIHLKQSNNYCMKTSSPENEYNKLKSQPQTEGCRGKTSIFDEMNKGVKVKIEKTRKIKRKYEIVSTDKIPIVKEKLK